MHKYSRQREAIKQCLMSRCDHPTADVVYESVRREYPQISLGTVYRNLSLLVELGEAVKVPCGDGLDHFDGSISPHMHFKCERCGKLMDLEVDDDGGIELLQKKACKGFKGKITTSLVVFGGICPQCMEDLGDL